VSSAWHGLTGNALITIPPYGGTFGLFSFLFSKFANAISIAGFLADAILIVYHISISIAFGEILGLLSLPIDPFLNILYLLLM
jgi:hypothetical protein